MKRLGFFVLCLFVIGTFKVQATVKIEGDPTDYVTITNALAHTVANDTVRVTTGLYVEVFNIYDMTVSIDGNYDTGCVSKVAGNTDLRPPFFGMSVIEISNSSIYLIDLDIGWGSPVGGSELNGGGVNIGWASKVYMAGCRVHNNRVNGYGGGIYITNSTLEVTNTVVISNQAFNVSGGVSGRGGGYAVLNAELAINGAHGGGPDCGVKYNHADDTGGGIYIERGECIAANETTDILYNTATNGGGIAAVNASYLEVIEGADVCGNQAFHAGGGILLANGSTGSIRDLSTYIGYNAFLLGPNVASNPAGGLSIGGAFAVHDSHLEIESSVRIAHNMATYWGGGLYLSNSFCSINNSSVGWPFSLTQTNEARAGGGLYLVRSELVLTNQATIHGNVTRLFDGGGIFAYDSTINMHDAIIRNNTANSDNGGGIYLSHSSITGRQSVICNNQALGMNDGGGLYGYGTLGYFEDMTITNNYASKDGGGIYWDGWAGDLLTITSNCSISRNRAGSNGGGLWLGAETEIFDAAINVNTATNDGGGLFISNTVVNISQTGLEYNRATGNGGGIALGYGADLQLHSGQGLTLIGGNRAANGAGIYIHSGSTATVTKAGYVLRIRNNEATENGGAVAVSGGSLVVTGAVTFAGNSALHDGGAFYAINSKVQMEGGVVIGDADTNNCNWAGRYGGGLASDSSTVTLDHVSFINNIATNYSGGLDLMDSVITGTNLWIEGNRAYRFDGGGMFGDDTEGTFTHTTFLSNAAPIGIGGGLAWSLASLHLTDCSVIQNQAAEGAGINLANCHAFFNRVTVTVNRATSSGGGILLENSATLYGTNLVLLSNLSDSGNGGGIMIHEHSRANLYGTNGLTLISSNSALYGGGVAVSNGYLFMEKNGWVQGNLATNSGAGLWIAQGSTAEVNGVYFLQNTAGISGGGVYLRTNALVFLYNSLLTENTIAPGGYGGGLRNFRGTAIIQACTIVSNAVGGVECDQSGSVLDMDGCIVYGHSLVNVTTNFDVEYCCIEGGYPGLGNFDEEPLLYNGNYHLTAWSPCRDRGWLVMGGRDVDNEARSGNLDVGFDEYVDGDNDNLPDIVETETDVWTSDIDMGTDPADNDSDSDGIFDGDEWLADTDPNNPSSFLRITNAIVTASGFFDVRWSGGTKAWQYYEVASDFATATGSPNWQIFSTRSPPTSPSGYETSLISTNTTVYRIRATRFP